MPAKLIKCVNSQSSSGKQKKSILMGLSFLLDIWLWSLYGTTKDKYMDIYKVYTTELIGG